MEELLFSLFLIIFSWQDYRRHQIKIVWLYGFGASGMVFMIVDCINAVTGSQSGLKQGAVEVAFCLLSMLPGLFLLFIESQTHGAVGSGDGLFFMITGCYLGVWSTFNLLIGAVFVSSIVGALWMFGVLLRGKGSALWEKMRRKRLPLLPCLLPVWMWMLISQNV